MILEKPTVSDFLESLPVGSVGGEGLWSSSWMIVGEAPGKAEEEQLRPFVGRSGQLLRRELDGVGMDPMRVWITNIYKNRPPENRTPTSEEIEEHLPYLQYEITEGHPKYILALGNVAFQTLVGTTLGISLYRGFWHPLSESIKPRYEAPELIEPLIMPTYHPAYILRNRKAIDTWRRDLKEWAIRDIQP